MAKQPLQTLVRHLHQLVGPRDSGTAEDRDLLARFVKHRDSVAFAALVERHGPMVRGVCRRLLRQESDLDDAFQATFLILLRKAHTIRKRQSVGSWLYGVAYRVASRARTQQKSEVRRRRSEVGSQKSEGGRPLESMTGDPGMQAAWRELCSVLDAEVHHLPEKYRAPLVLCYMEGQTRDQAARQLGCPLRTLDRRLEQGRERLRARLARRGITLSAALLTTGLSQQVSVAALAPALVEQTIQAACGLAAGHAATLTGISPKAILLAEVALKGAVPMQLKVLAGVLLVAAVALGGAGVMARQILPVTDLTPSPPSLSGKGAGGIGAARDDKQAKDDATKPARTDRYGDPLPPGALVRMGTVRLRGDNDRHVSFSEDGKTLMSAGSGPTIRFWEVATGKLAQKNDFKQIEPPWGLVSTDGKTVVSEQKKLFIVWDVPTARELGRIPVPEPQPMGLALSPGAETLAVGNYDAATGHLIALWDVATGEQRCQLSRLRLPPSSLLFSPDGKLLATANHDRKVRLWDAVSGKEVQQIEEQASKLVFSSDGKSLATAGTTVKLWEVTTGQAQAAFSANGAGGFYSLVFAPNGTRLAAGTREEIIVWDLANRKLRRKWPSRNNFRLAFSRDGSTLASSGGRAIHLWDAASGRPLHSYPGHEGDVASVAYSPDGKYLVSISWEEKTLCLWETATGKLLRVLTGHENYARTAAFSSDGNFIISGAGDGTLRLWETATGNEVRKFPVQAISPEDGKPHVKSVRFSTDGRRVTASSMAGDAIPHFQVDTWNIATGDVITHRAVQRDASCLTSDGETLSVWKLDGFVIQETASGREIVSIKEQLSEPLAFSSDGRILAASISLPPPPGTMGRGDVEAVTLWEAATGRLCLRIQTGAFAMLAFSPDGRVLATASREAVTFWEIATGKKLRRIPLHEKYRSVFGDSLVSCLAFSPDGRTLATGLADTTVLVWDLNPGTDRAEHSKTNFDSKELDKVWADLAREDASAAYQAIWTMAAQPEKTTRLLSEHLKPVAQDSKRVSQLIADLDDSQFAVREAAAKELAKLGEQIEPDFHQVLAKKPSAEVRKRLESLLVAPRPIPAGETLRTLRAIQVLEYIGTSEARQILRKLAAGAPGARQTREAQAALDRLARRPASTP